MTANGYYFLVLHGRLKIEEEEGVIQWRFAEDVEPGTEPKVHPVTHGDMLKVFDHENTLVWSGVVAYSYEMMAVPDPNKPGETVQRISGRLVSGIQTSARPVPWLQWFEQGYRAQLEIRLTDQNTPEIEPIINEDDPEGSHDKAAERERLIEGVLTAHDKAGVGKPQRPGNPDRKKPWWED